VSVVGTLRRFREITVVIVAACRARIVTVWRYAVSLALHPVPYYTRWGLYPQAAVVVACLFAFQWWPPIPTVGIGFLAVVAVIMTVRADRFSHGEKVVYVLIAFALFFVEMRAIYKDREDHDREQAEAREREAKSFETIANGITEAIKESDRNFAKVMERSDRILGGVVDSIKAQTGGDSFAFITPTAEPAQAFEMHWNNFFAPKGKPYFLVSVTSHGKYPLRGPHATMMDDERRLAAMQEYNSHPDGDWIKAINAADTEYQIPYLRPQSTEAPQGEVDVLGIYPMPQGDFKKLTIIFSAPNGLWNETLHLGRVNGVWHQCLSVLGPTVKQAKQPFIHCDSEWPDGRALAEKDWLIPKSQAHVTR
jgi:hypothetical protein